MRKREPRRDGQMRDRVKEDLGVEKGQRAFSVSESDSTQKKVSCQKKSLISLFRPKHDDQESYSILKTLTHDKRQTGSEGSWLILASVITIWTTATIGKHKQRSTYCGETGNRELHMPRVPIALEHLHSNQHTHHHRHFLILTLQIGKRTMYIEDFNVVLTNPLSLIIEKTYTYITICFKLYMDLQYDYHIVCVPTIAEMTSLIMYDFLFCWKWVDE